MACQRHIGRAGLIGAVTVLIAASAAKPVLAQETLELAVKATYLYKFAPFVDWPDGAFASTVAPFTICVVGNDPFGSLLDRAVAGQRVGARAIVVRRVAVAFPGQPCQIMYLGGSPAQPVSRALKAMRGAPVLTVTDGSSAPGIVDFLLSDGRVQFRIDDEAAAQGGLAISSKLLHIAVEVAPRRAEHQ